MSQRRLDPLYSENLLSTDDILKIIGNDYIRILEEKKAVKDAIIKLHEFFYHKTPVWKTPPTIHDLMHTTIKEGVPEDILWQYQEENQTDNFDKYSIVISNSMSAIDDAIEYLEDRFWRLEHLQAPPSSVSSIPTNPPPIIKPEGGGIIESLANKFRSISQNFSKSPHERIQKVIDYYQEIPEVWALILEYHSTAVAREGVSWSSIMKRSGMANFLQIMQSNFSYWIEPKLLEAVSLSHKARLKENKNFADRFIQGMAYAQKQHEQQSGQKF